MTREQRDSCTVTLTLPIGPDRERTVRAARRWFELCPPALHGAFGAAVRDPVLARSGPVGAAVSVAMFNPACPEPSEWSEVYTPRSFGDLLRRLADLPDAADFEGYRIDAEGRRSRPGFSVGLITHGDHLDLFSTIDAMADDPAILATVRAVAELAAPLAVAVAVQGSQRVTPLELALSQANTTYVRRPAEVLRNYGWLTVLSDELAERVGGGDHLRASGAFVEAEPLAAGGWWLLATKTWDEYGPEQANRLFELLAPVLPPGKPELTQWRFPGRGQAPIEVTLPNAVAERDPREIAG